MRSLSHGGSQTISTHASVTPGIAFTLYRTSLGICWADGHAGLVSVIFALPIDHYVVDESELVDVDGNFRVVDGLHRLDDGRLQLSDCCRIGRTDLSLIFRRLGCGRHKRVDVEIGFRLGLFRSSRLP